ncbi:MAG: GlsB/YeaQ/YmgE family stress response membrane protein [Hyphomicrobiaceae bacterium]|nr:MAG: GlsB/YeaQ/YmgE family stress response membrane protein [Hyphomicrobiaceae bacterium]
MNTQQLIIMAVVGIIAGWLASLVVGGGGILRYLITGLIGAFVGGFVFNAAGWKLNLGNEWLEQIVIAAIGAIIIVILARLIA